MRTLILGLLCFVTGSSFAQHFTEVSRSVGIDDLYEPRFLMGGGAAFFDANGDGFLDIYATGGFLTDKLYINNGDGTFTDNALDLGLGVTEDYFTTAVAVADIENDGDQDILVTTWVGSTDGQNKRNLFFINDGDGNFLEKGEDLGFLEQSWSMGGVFGDVNRDGFLDVYIINYVNAHGSIEVDDDGNVTFYEPDCFGNYMYINNGDGTFYEASEEFETRDDGGCSLAASFTDYNNDQWPDLLVANDFGWWAQPNKLFQNQGSLFSDISEESNMNIPMFGMGIAIGDYDEDQDLDYYITNIRGNALMNNQGDQTFDDMAMAAGVDNTFTNDEFTTGWGAVFFDYDNDSYLDLGVTNGYVATEPIIYTALQDEDRMFRNLGDGTFEDVSVQTGFNSKEISRGLITGDYDNDGDLDAFVMVSRSFESIDPHFLLYLNETENSNNWLKVKLVGRESPRDAYGSMVKLYADGRVLMREIDGGSSHASHNSSIAHFGLGDIDEVDKIEVLWTSGRVQEINSIDINSLNIIEEDTSIEIITSVDQTFDNRSVIYPNPVFDGSSISLQLNGELLDNYDLTLHNVHGKSFKPCVISDENDLLKMDITGLPNGNYVLRYNSGKSSLQEVFLIQR